MSEEVQNNPINDLVQFALDQNYNQANKIFDNMMGAKINDALDQEKIRLADQIYNGMDPEDEDDQMDLDLEDEDDTNLADEDEDEDEYEEGEEIEDEEDEDDES
jgi:hypothetical protein